MRKSEIKKAVWRTVRSAKVFVYSTVDARGNPQSRHMGGLMVKGGVIYMATASGARKVRQIKRNPRSQLLFAAKDYRKVVTISGKSVVEKRLDVPSSTGIVCFHTAGIKDCGRAS